MLLANLIAMLFQALSAKLGIVTGRNLAEMCRERFPSPVVWIMWIVSEIAAMATDLAEFRGAGSDDRPGHVHLALDIMGRFVSRGLAHSATIGGTILVRTLNLSLVLQTFGIPVPV